MKAKAPWYIYNFQDLIDVMERQESKAENIEVHGVSTSEFSTERAPFLSTPLLDEVAVKVN